MAKRTLRDNISTGILSAPNVASIGGISPPTVYKWLKQNKLKFFRIPGTAEKRISAQSVLVLFESDGMPVSAELAEAATAFRAKYNDDFTLKDEYSEEDQDEEQALADGLTE